MIIALDVWNKRVGIAKSVWNISMPYKVVERVKIVQELKKIYKENPFETLVVWLPFLNGELSLQAVKISAFCEKLKEYFPTIQIETIDESYTTNIARMYSDADNIDDIAAQIILESYLSNQK